MSDPTDPGGVTGSHERGPRNTARGNGSGSPVGSPLSIVLALVAVAAGFLIFRSISDDGDAGGFPGAGGETTVATVAGGGTAPPAVAGATSAPAVTAAPTREGATVVVANASSTGQMAGPMSEQLAELGYTMGEPTSQVEGPDNLETSIVYFSVANNSEAVARQLALDMGGLEVEPMPDEVPTEGGTIDGVVLLMLGNDYAGEDVPGAPSAVPTIPSVVTTTTQPT